MLDSVDDEFRSMKEVDCLGGPVKICESFIAILKTGECRFWDDPAVLYRNYGLKRMELAHSYYGFRAVEYLAGSVFELGVKW